MKNENLQFSLNSNKLSSNSVIQEKTRRNVAYLYVDVNIS